MGVSTVARTSEFLLLYDYWPESFSAGEFVAVYFQGARLDSLTIGHLMAPTWLFAVVAVKVERAVRWAQWTRRATAAALAVAVPLLTAASVVNFRELQDTFAATSFEIFHGNMTNVVMLAERKHHMLSRGIALLGFSILIYWAYWRLERRITFPPRLVPRHPTMKRLMFAGAICLYVVASRASLGHQPVRRNDAGVSRHSVFNVCAMNPMVALKYAYQDYRSLVSVSGTNPFVAEEELDDVALKLAPEIKSQSGVGSLKIPNVFRMSHPVWQRTVRRDPPVVGSAGPDPQATPSHVFVLFLESYDSWPFLDEFSDLRLVEEGKRLARQGVHIRNYLPGTAASITSYHVAIQGIFETKRMIQHELPTSLIHNLRRLGYRTRSVAGYSSEAGNEARYVKQQGFDEWHFAANIPKTSRAPLQRVHDHDVYDFVASKLNYDRPTLTFIRTISNHTPWSVDLEKHKCEIGPIPDHLLRRGHNHLSELRQSMGHLRYTDRAMGRFVKRMIERYPDSLFVITGDHFGRNHFDRIASLYGRSSVPLILYGPNVLPKNVDANQCGSHVDLAATLIERCAPDGFRYAAMGRDLLRPCKSPFGVGTDVVTFSDCIVNLKQTATCEPLPWTSRQTFTPAEQKQRIERARHLHKAYHGIGFAMATAAMSRDSSVGAWSTGGRKTGGSSQAGRPLHAFDFANVHEHARDADEAGRRRE